MKREIIPTWEELERHKSIIPEINPAAVIAMLGIKTAAEEIQQAILDVLQRDVVALPRERAADRPLDHGRLGRQGQRFDGAADRCPPPPRSLRRATARR